MKSLKLLLAVSATLVMIGCSSDTVEESIKNTSNDYTESKKEVFPDDVNRDLDKSSRKSQLTQEVMDSITYMYSEEGLAMDVYNNIYKIQKLPQLINIANNSEIRHIEAVNKLAIKYDLNVTKYPDTEKPYSVDDMNRYGSGEYPVEPIQELYNLLYDKGIQSKRDAFEVGCMVEVVDIKDLDEFIHLAEGAKDIVNVFSNLRNGSYSHYWAFDKGLKRMGVKNGCCDVPEALGFNFCHPEYPKN